MLKTYLSALLLAALCGPAIAAGGKEDGRTRRVSYSDLDLVRAEDRATLDRRLKAAAVKACRYEYRGSVYLPVELPSCVQRTLADARRSASAAVARASEHLAPGRGSSDLPAGGE